jgi:hypothetical protein
MKKKSGIQLFPASLEENVNKYRISIDEITQKFEGNDTQKRYNLGLSSRLYLFIIGGMLDTCIYIKWEN